MSLTFMDSFAHYAIGQMDRKWLFSSGNDIITGNGGRAALRMSPTGQAMFSIPAQSFVTIGFRIKFDRTNTSAEIFSAAGVGLSRTLRSYFSLFILPDGQLSIWAGDGSTLLGQTGDFKVSDSIYYYFELKFSTSTGNSGPNKTVIISDASMRIDGTGRISGGNGSTVVPETDWITPAGEVDVFKFTSSAGTNTGMIIQDLYVFDQNGTVNNDFAGDSSMGCIYPKADVHTDWTPSAGSTHFPLVNEHICDDDATYISSLIAGQRDEFDFDDVTVVGEITGAQYLICARKTDEGVRSLKATMNAMEFGNEQFINDSYLYYRKPFDLDPPEDASTFNGRTWGVVVKS